MFTTRHVVSMFSIAMLLLGAGAVFGQAYPTKPIRIYTGSAGGSNNAASRLIASGISGPLGQPIIIENRGSTVISAQIVATAPPDGYSLVLGGDIIWLGPLLRGEPSQLGDFAAISMLASAPNILVVHPSLPVKSVKDLIALAKARPGELNYGSGGLGGIDHLAPEIFKSTLGVKMEQVLFKGSTAAALAVATGEVQVMFPGVTVIEPHIQAGRVRALAVTSAQPSALVAGLPTLAASGLPGFDLA